MKEHLYQKCLQCPWLWGCGLWWCLQWWCWLWGCSTMTPIDLLDSPTEITHTTAAQYLLIYSPFHIFPPSVAFCVFQFLPLAVSVLSIYLSASPYSLLSLLPPARCHISPGSVMAARNDIIRYILSHLPPSFSPPTPVSFLLTLPSLHGFSSFQKVCMLARSSLLRGMDTSPMGSFLLKRS